MCGAQDDLLIHRARSPFPAGEGLGKSRHFVCTNSPTKQNLKDKLMFIGVFARTKWREPYLVGRCLGAAENVRFIGCYGGSKPPPYGFVRKSNTPINQNLNDKLMFVGEMYSRRGGFHIRPFVDFGSIWNAPLRCLCVAISLYKTHR